MWNEAKGALGWDGEAWCFGGRGYWYGDDRTAMGGLQRHQLVWLADDRVADGIGESRITNRVLQLSLLLLLFFITSTIIYFYFFFSKNHFSVIGKGNLFN